MAPPPSIESVRHQLLPNRAATASQTTIGSLLQAAAVILRESGSDSPSIDAAVLLCHVLDKPRSYLLTWPEKCLTTAELDAFVDLVEQRVAGEPIAYIVGEREFWSLPLKTSRATLIPRSDTERLVELALEKLPSAPVAILDLGTGTGAIALALASEQPQHWVIGVDIMPEAQQLAQQNAACLSLSNVQFAQGSWFEPLEKGSLSWDKSHFGIKFALIVSNPPYIDQDDPHLQQGDVRFEPVSALIAPENGLADIRYIAQNSRHYLVSEGWLMFEHGWDQGEAVRDILASLGYVNIVTAQDYAGNDRVTMAQLYLS